jgi:predicted DCC family thiol-disulfide oxidoreductase YuxK
MPDESINQDSDTVAKTHFVLYDSECPLCTFQMRILTWLDWFNVVSLLPISSDKAREVAPTIEREDLMEAIHCVTPDGAIHRGARCLRFVGMRMPLLIPLALILWLPGVIWIAEKVYMWISRNRYILSRVFGCKGACAVMPARKRDNEGAKAVPFEGDSRSTNKAS